MRKLLTVTITAAAFCGAPAIAADMPVKAAPPAPIFDWSGFYAGGSIGATWWNDNYSFLFGAPATWGYDPTKGVVAGIVGVQKQIGSLIVGFEGGMATTFGRNLGSDICHPAAVCGPGNTRHGRLSDPIWSVGPRVGWALGQWMPYLTGGYATTKLQVTVLDPAAALIEHGEGRHDGWYIGAGADWALSPNWILGVEYRHYDFRSKTVVPITAAGAPAPGDTWSEDPKLDMVAVRLTYKFDNTWGKGPVVVKY